jgi:hypothetical protein
MERHCKVILQMVMRVSRLAGMCMPVCTCLPLERPSKRLQFAVHRVSHQSKRATARPSRRLQVYSVQCWYWPWRPKKRMVNPLLSCVAHGCLNHAPDGHAIRVKCLGYIHERCDHTVLADSANKNWVRASSTCPHCLLIWFYAMMGMQCYLACNHYDAVIWMVRLHCKPLGARVVHTCHHWLISCDSDTKRRLSWNGMVRVFIAGT